MKQIILSGGDLGGEIIEVEDSEQEITVEENKYRIINGQAVYEGKE